jgi:hypothetical protein
MFSFFFKKEKENSSLGFSWIIVGAPYTPKNEVLYRVKKTLSLLDAIPRNFNRKREERTLHETTIDFPKFTCVTTNPDSELRNINLIPFRNVEAILNKKNSLH